MFRLVAWAIDAQGSTRSAALIRVGLAVIAWSRWANELVLFRNPGPKYLLIALSFYVSTALMFVGYRSRFSTAWAAATMLSMYYIGGIYYGREPWTHHHTYLLGIATLFCALTPCGRSYSLDRWLSIRKAEQEGTPMPREYGPLWGIRLISIQVALVYFWSAYNKLNWGFLSGERMQQLLMYHYFGSDYPDWPLFGAMCLVSAWMTVLLEFALCGGLFFARTRMYLLIPGLLFHGLIYMLFSVYTFTATMWLLYLAFLDADAVHDRIDHLQAGRKPAQKPPVQESARQ